jgi:acetyl esterase/lipase
MTASVGLFLLGSISLLATLCVLFRGPNLGGFIVPYFFIAWLQGELAVYQILWQAALAVWLVTRDALASELGIAGLVLLLLSFAGLARSLQLSVQAKVTFDNALRATLGESYRDTISQERRATLRDGIDWREWMRPFSFKRSGVRVLRNIPYGPAGVRNQLDIYQPEVLREGGCPVLLQVHGGAWMIGHKKQQALPLMYHMAQRGWLCVSINYRLSPKATFPEHIEDVKLALAWVKLHIDEFGGDPSYVAITGGSAGGHLCSLAALTPNVASLQPGIEHLDTQVQAAVPIYGVYDWLDESGSGGIAVLQELLARWVMKSTPTGDESMWREGRPLAHVNVDAPPMMMVHGSHDSLVAVEDARYFVQALREVSANPVVYAELQGAQHAFEIFHSMRCDYAVTAVAQFLEWCHSEWRAERGD